MLVTLALGAAIVAPGSMAFARGPDPAPDDMKALDASLADITASLASAEPQGRRPSGVAEQLAWWAIISNDNGPLPFMIVDKLGARIFAFDQWGEFLGSAPVLVGMARGDDSAPGIGDLKLSAISDEQRTTPAGRFVATFGASEGHGTVLWVDLPNAISLHPVMSVNAGEHRMKRIKSSDPSQHRISYGCINVPASFYNGVVMKALAGGPAIVYVLPDTKSVDEVFPTFAASQRLTAETDLAPQQVSRADIP